MSAARPNGTALPSFGSARHEFLPEPAYGCLGWPISRNDLAPYYEQAEAPTGRAHLRLRTGPLRQFSSVCRAPLPAGKARRCPWGSPVDILNDPTEAAHFDGFASVKRLKGEAETSILSQLNGRTNFTLLPDAEVEALLGHPDSPATVIGVRLRDRTNVLRTASIAWPQAHCIRPACCPATSAEARLNSTLPAAALVGRYVKLHLLTAMVSVSLGIKTDLIRKTTVLTNERFPHSSVQPLGFDAALIETLMPRFLPRALRRAVARRAYGFFLQTEDGSDADNRVLQGRAASPGLH